MTDQDLNDAQLYRADRQLKTYFSVVTTPSYGLVHDAARPYAVVEVSKETGKITHVVNRYETHRRAALACGKGNKRAGSPVLDGIRPPCSVCGWRKGGLDSWDGVACKCGHTSPPIAHVEG